MSPFAISFLEKMRNTGDKLKVKDDIRKFVRIRNTLNDTFNTIEDYLKERRSHGSACQNQRIAGDEKHFHG